MSRQPHYRRTPGSQSGIPPGIPYIVGNEAAERFSYYGMRGILVVFMTQHLLGADGSTAPMSEEQAKSWYHLFSSAVYFFPLLGALISDAFFGKYKTILWLSCIYCCGHLALALDETRIGLLLGLILIAIGSGGIKPCVSAHVGDQFGDNNRHLLGRVFGWFYIAINLGAFASSLLTPWLLTHYGPAVAFGVPGLLMFIATVVFWLGRRKFIHVLPVGWSAVVRQFRDPIGAGRLRKLGLIYLTVAVFWSLYDQTGAAWVLQAREMDLRFAGVQWLPSQIQAVNPVLVIVLIPLFSSVVYPALGRVLRLTSVVKITIGMLTAALAFLVPALAECWIGLGLRPSIGWQLFAYLLLTAAEVMVSVTFLEFSYTEAPVALKSMVMAFYLMSVSLGNLFTALVNVILGSGYGGVWLLGPGYYVFFAVLMVLASVAFVAAAKRLSLQTVI